MGSREVCKEPFSLSPFRRPPRDQTEQLDRGGSRRQSYERCATTQHTAHISLRTGGARNVLCFDRTLSIPGSQNFVARSFAPAFTILP